jgi:hypothetical protein
VKADGMGIVLGREIAKRPTTARNGVRALPSTREKNLEIYLQESAVKNQEADQAGGV